MTHAAALLAMSCVATVMGEPAQVTGAWHGTLVNFGLDAGIVVLVAAIAMCLVRLLRGPHLADRAVAVDTMATQLVGLVVLFTLRIDALVLFDGVLVLSLIGFAGTVAMAQYLIRRALRRRARASPVVVEDPDAVEG